LKIYLLTVSLAYEPRQLPALFARRLVKNSVRSGVEHTLGKALKMAGSHRP